MFGAKNESRGRGEEEERERVELCDVPPRKVITTDTPTFKASNLGGLLMPEWNKTGVSNSNTHWGQNLKLGAKSGAKNYWKNLPTKNNVTLHTCKIKKMHKM